MKNKTLSKIMAVVMMSAVLLNSNMVANAKTASTDFGTMTYSLTTGKNSSGKTATAKTSMPANSKTYSYVRTKLEVQINSTGAKILQGDVKGYYKKNTKITATAKTIKSYNVTKLAVFSCHEVVGRTSTERYEVVTI